MKRSKTFRLVFLVFLFSLFVAQHYVGDHRLETGFSSASAQEGQFELRYGTLEKSIDDYLMLAVAEDHRLRGEVIFIDRETTIRTDFIQLQIVDLKGIDTNRSNDPLTFTIRQFDHLLYNESNGKIAGFENLDSWNDTIEMSRGEGWGNLYFNPTDMKQNIWISYKDVTIKFYTETLDENLLAPVMTNGEYLQRMIGFGLVSALIFGFGVVAGVLVEWKAKEIQIPERATTYIWIGSLVLTMFVQMILLTFDISFTREMFFVVLGVAGFFIGIKTYVGDFHKWTLIEREIDSEGNIEWNIRNIRVYTEGDRFFILLDGFWQSVGRIVGWHVEIVTDLTSYDQSKRTSRVLFVLEAKTIKHKDGLQGIAHRTYDIKVRPWHRKKIEDSRVDNLKMSELENELRDLDLELKSERAKVKAEAYRHRAVTEELEFKIMGLQLFRSGGITDETIRQMAKARLRARGEKVTEKTLNEEMKKVREEINSEATEIENGEYNKRGIMKKLKTMSSFGNGSKKKSSNGGSHLE